MEHSAAANSQDPIGAREAHGDEVIADALASRLMSLKKTIKQAVENDAPWMSPAWRIKQQEEAEAMAARNDW